MSAREFDILSRLIGFDVSIDELTTLMSELPIDIPDQVVLTSEKLYKVLARFLSDELTSREVARWAEMVETRDGVAMEEPVTSIVFELANPDIHNALDAHAAKHFIAELKIADSGWRTD
jgi:hypothetical protein